MYCVCVSVQYLNTFRVTFLVVITLVGHGCHPFAETPVVDLKLLVLLLEMLPQHCPTPHMLKLLVCCLRYLDVLNSFISNSDHKV